MYDKNRLAKTESHAPTESFELALAMGKQHMALTMTQLSKSVGVDAAI